MRGIGLVSVSLASAGEDGGMSGALGLGEAGGIGKGRAAVARGRLLDLVRWSEGRSGGNVGGDGVKPGLVSETQAWSLVTPQVSRKRCKAWLTVRG